MNNIFRNVLQWIMSCFIQWKLKFIIVGRILTSNLKYLILFYLLFWLQLVSERVQKYKQKINAMEKIITGYWPVYRRHYYWSIDSNTDYWEDDIVQD